MTAATCRICTASNVFHAALSDVGLGNLALSVPWFEEDDGRLYVEFDADEVTDNERAAIVRGEAMAIEHVERLHPPARCYGPDGLPACEKAAS